jgi:hypothetical protein
MKLAITALLVGSAAAFAPAPMGRTSSVAQMSYENELGVLNPTGFFDPLGLTEDIDQATFDQYRTAELKHGRVAQLCVLGYITPEIFRWPGDIAPGIAFADIPNGIAAIDAIPTLGWLQIVFLVGAVDYFGYLGDFASGKPDLDPETLEERQTQELQHGRLAMLATMELLRHDAQNLASPGFDGLDNLITGLPFLYE